MRNYSEILDRVLERYEQNDITFDDYVACYFFANMRQLIESESATNSYPTIYFYACWILHPNLDRNNTSLDILSTVTNSLPSTSEIEPSFIDLVCENLKLEKLQYEITQLYTNYNVRTILADTNHWNDICGVILNLVTLKPLCPPIKIRAGMNFQITPNDNPLITEDSSLRLWLHGERGSQAEWTLAIVPDAESFNPNNVDQYLTFNGGVFTR